MKQVPMNRQPCLIVGFLLLANGCAVDSPKGKLDQASPDALEKHVRAVIAEQLRIDASAIPMNKPLSDPPIKADDLDLVEIVMDLEERFGVEITGAAVERYLGGPLGTVPARITPNQLVTLVREAPKIPQLKRKK